MERPYIFLVLFVSFSFLGKTSSNSPQHEKSLMISIIDDCKEITYGLSFPLLVMVIIYIYISKQTLQHNCDLETLKLQHELRLLKDQLTTEKRATTDFKTQNIRLQAELRINKEQTELKQINRFSPENVTQLTADTSVLQKRTRIRTISGGSSVASEHSDGDGEHSKTIVRTAMPKRRSIQEFFDGLPLDHSYALIPDSGLVSDASMYEPQSNISSDNE